MNKTVLLLVGIILSTIVGYTLLDVSSKNRKEQIVPTSVSTVATAPASVDFSASFAIFTNGTFRIFTAAMYHNLSKDVFIEKDNPNTVHVEKTGVTWDDFFKTLPFKLSKDCLTTGTKQTFCTDTNGRLRFYLNGKEDANVLDKQIENGDQLLVTYGNENEKQIENQLQQVPTPYKNGKISN